MRIADCGLRSADLGERLGWLAGLRACGDFNDRLKALLQLGVLLVGVGVQAEPLVTGFERFHGEAATREGGALLYSELGCVRVAPSPAASDYLIH